MSRRNKTSGMFFSRGATPSEAGIRPELGRPGGQGKLAFPGMCGGEGKDRAIGRLQGTSRHPGRMVLGPVRRQGDVLGRCGPARELRTWCTGLKARGHRQAHGVSQTSWPGWSSRLKAPEGVGDEPAVPDALQDVVLVPQRVQRDAQRPCQRARGGSGEDQEAVVEPQPLCPIRARCSSPRPSRLLPAWASRMPRWTSRNNGTGAGRRSRRRGEARDRS